MKKFNRLGLIAAAAALLSAGLARADVKMPEIFGDHMVLQQDKDLPFWGWADAGETVTVTAGTSKGSAVAGKDGKWMLKLAPLPVNDAPMDVTIAGKNAIVFHDVVVGDIWICSGQSNMEFGIAGEASAKTELPKANYPLIRLFFVPKATAGTPQGRMGYVEGQTPKPEWVVCTPESIAPQGTWGGFSAVGFYFGREIHEFTHHPVGLIHTNWGGTPAQSWTSALTIASAPEFADFAKASANYRENFDKLVANYKSDLVHFKADSEKWEKDNKEALAAYQVKYKEWVGHANEMDVEPKPAPVKPVPSPKPVAPSDPLHNAWTPTSLYNGMISPLVPYAIKGAIWYQGEANAGDPDGYRVLFPAMITDWRKNWNQGDFPFFFVQLANYMGTKADPSDTKWARLREAQTMTLKLPNTGQAVIIDIGEAGDIHPKDKWDVGIRLALQAKHVAYGQDLVYSGPMFKELKIEGVKARVTFNHVGSGLVIGQPPEHFHPGAARNAPTKLEGFAIAGADHQFFWADATIDGQTVVLSSPKVPEPVDVRYGWGDNPIVTLYNKEGLPACPFRTDSLPLPVPTPAAPPAPAAAPAPKPATAVAPKHEEAPLAPPELPPAGK